MTDAAHETESDALVAYERIEPLRAHEYVAEQLRRHIGLGIVAAGEAFPPERELAQRFGVGRATIQHALRLLEADRLVQSRRGRHGGTFVVAPQRDEQGLQRLLLELRLSKDQVADALVYRRVMEETTARLAAQVATAPEIDAIAAAQESMRDSPDDTDFHRRDTEFHLLVARASHNALLYEGVERARLLLNTAIFAQPESELWHERIARGHDAILGAIRAHDPKRATRAMAAHLEQTEQSIRAFLAALG